MTTQADTVADRMVRGWIGFAAIVVVATWLFGPVSVAVAMVPAGVALIATGVMVAGWRRPALIVAGALLLVVLAVDVEFGHWLTGTT